MILEPIHQNLPWNLVYIYIIYLETKLAWNMLSAIEGFLIKRTVFQKSKHSLTTQRKDNEVKL